MKIISFIRDSMGLRPVEVEISLTPGLPKIQFLGLPDTLIKESVLRIQSALKHCGYKLPKARQVLVQLKPNYLKKSSQGLDLAVACGILWESGQERPPDAQSIALYGELSLKGEVFAPDDFQDLVEKPMTDIVMTGQNPCLQNFDLLILQKLNDIQNPTFVAKSEICDNFKEPDLPQIQVTGAQAELLRIIAVGEHPTLFAGPPGTGKTTLAMLSSLLLKNPDTKSFKVSQQISRRFGLPLTWRPIVSPHHTSTALSMIGGGNIPRPGEITRAHGGVLIMDEFLEFAPEVKEALREPLETGQITISRAGYVQTYLAKFLLLATTNLCPCGHLVPDKNFECQGKIRYCHSHLHKLSGPIMDRFHILNFSHAWGKNGSIKTKALKNEILKIQDFKKEREKKISVNKDLPQISEQEILEMDLDILERDQFLPREGASHRRYLALLKVARTIADCDLSLKIQAHHIEKAREYTQAPFYSLKSFMQNY